MISINALLFLFVLEFLLISSCLTIVLFMKNRKHSVREIHIRKKREGLQSYLEKEVLEQQNKVNKFKDEMDNKEDFETLMVRERLVTKLGFLQAALDELTKSEGDDISFWENTHTQFNEIMKDLFQRMRELEMGRRRALKKTLDSDEEVVKLNDLVKDLKQKVTALYMYKDMFQNLEKKFKKIHEMNGTLKQNLITAMEKLGESEEIEKMLSQFEHSNKELEMCAGVLEMENKRLQEKMEGFEAEVNTLSDVLEESVTREEFEKVQAENESSSKKIEELESELQDKINAHTELQNNFGYLEKEYYALYKEHVAD